MKSIRLILSAAASAALFAAALPCLAIPSPAAQQPTDASAQQLRASLRSLDSTFRMSDGKLLHVEGVGSDTVRIRYGNRNHRWLHHDGNGAFVSRDGQIVLKFDVDAATGEAQNVSLTMPARAG